MLRRDGYKCRESARYKAIPDEATTVHHVWPAEDFPEWAWCEWNLIAVSQKAHDSLHDRRSGKLTEKGLAWQRRVIPPLKSAMSEHSGAPTCGNISDGGKTGGGG